MCCGGKELDKGGVDTWTQNVNKKRLSKKSRLDPNRYCMSNSLKGYVYNFLYHTEQVFVGLYFLLLVAVVTRMN